MSIKKHHHHHQGADWRAVTDALNALGDSIAHVTTAGVDDDENRRRMRELSDGLSDLAARLVSAAEPVPTTAATLPEPSGDASAAVTVEPTPVGTHGAPSEAHWDLPPSMLEAFLAANEKFRAAEGKHRVPVSAAAVEAAAAAASAPAVAGEPVPATAEPPAPIAAEQPHPASVTGAFKAVIAEKMSSLIGGVATRVGAHTGADEETAEPESSIQDWLYPEGLPESEIQVDSELEPAAGMAEPPADPESVRTEAVMKAPPAAAASHDAQPPAAEPTAAAIATEHTATTEPTEPTEPAVTAETTHAVPPVVPGTLDPLEPLRIAHERFRAERRSAEESASKAREFAAAHKKGKPAPPPNPPSDDNAPLW